MRSPGVNWIYWMLWFSPCTMIAIRFNAQKFIIYYYIVYYGELSFTVL